MWNNEQVDWISRIGRTAFVLLFLAGEGRPVRAREVSQRLKADYETAREYLFKLAELGAAQHTPAGWRLTPAACRLLDAGMSWAAAETPQESPDYFEPPACSEPPACLEQPACSEPPAAKNLRGAEGADQRGHSEADESRGTAEIPLFAENRLLNGAAEARLSELDRLNALLPRLGEPILIIKVNQALKDSLIESFKDPESLIITIGPENAAGVQGSRGAGEQGGGGAAIENVAGERRCAYGSGDTEHRGDGRTSFAQRRGRVGEGQPDGWPEGEGGQNMPGANAKLPAGDILSAQDRQSAEAILPAKAKLSAGEILSAQDRQTADAVQPAGDILSAQDRQPAGDMLQAGAMLSAQGTTGEDEARLAELGQALHRAGILRNQRTRHLFESEHLTAAHAAGIEQQLKKRKGRHYQPGLLVVALEGIQPGDPPTPVGFDGQNASRYAEWND